MHIHKRTLSYDVFKRQSVRPALSLVMLVLYGLSGGCTFPQVGGVSTAPIGHDTVVEETAGSSAPAVPPRQRTRFTNTVGMELVLIPAGEFQMGSSPGEPGRQNWEGPVHPVRIVKPFWIGVCEVTQDQFDRVMRRNPSNVRTSPRLPVTMVKWGDAVAFCRQLSLREGRAYRLPTEAEWEYACRAGSVTPWFFGSDSERLEEYAHCRQPSPQLVETPYEVGQLKPNPWGLYDVYGNVAEWVMDIVAFDRANKRGGMSAHEFDLPPYRPDSQKDTDGKGTGNGRIVRGGSCYPMEPRFWAWYCRSAARKGLYSFMASWDVGFRVVCEDEHTSG